MVRCWAATQSTWAHSGRAVWFTSEYCISIAAYAHVIAAVVVAACDQCKCGECSVLDSRVASTTQIDECGVSSSEASLLGCSLVVGETYVGTFGRVRCQHSRYCAVQLLGITDQPREER